MGSIVDTVFTYFKSGKMKSQIPYMNNNPNGEKIVFFESGMIRLKGTLKNGNKIGEWCEYDSLGVSKKCIKYNNN